MILYEPYCSRFAFKTRAVANLEALDGFVHETTRAGAWALCYTAIAEAKFGNSIQSEMLAFEAFDLATELKSPGSVGMARLAQALAFEALGKGDMARIRLHELEQNLVEQGMIEPAQEVGLELDRLTGNSVSASLRLTWFEENSRKNLAHIALRYFPELKTESQQPPTIASPESVPHLEVLGSMQIKLESQTTPVRGRKRQELLALLLEARISGRSEVSKLELVDKLYPDSDEIQANAGLRDVIYQIRSSLGESTLTTTMNGYALGSLKTDVESFLETGNTQLWRGVYLEGLTLETSDTVRESLYLALRTRAEALLETDPNEVTRVGRLLCEADPYDLEALRLTVTGLRSQQNHRSLTRFYDAARTRFLEIGETLPETWQEFLSPVTSG